MSVEKIYKGGWDDETVPVKVLGGELDGVSYVLEGAPTLRQGENYLFAVEVYPDSYPSLINLDQSVFEMDSGVAVNSEMATTEEITLQKMLDCFA